MLSKEDARARVRDLVHGLTSNREKYLGQSEDDTRVKLIDRMFEALGWDVFGDSIPDEVEREITIRTKDSSKKRADYTFKVNGITRLIVEAKAVSEDISKDEYISQAVNYAYNRDCSWAVLTNFAKTRIFIVDRKGGTPFYRIEFLESADFDENFEILWNLSKESVMSNRLEEEAKRRGLSIEKVRVGEQLLDDLKSWREILSREVKKNYGDKYPPETIDEIVQRIIDRLIFIRKAEDGGLEDPSLEPVYRRRNENTYNEVKAIFREYRDKYDSKLFEEDRRSLHESDKIELSNETIEKVIRGTLRPADGRVKYDFDSMDADILGAIYEQYLAFVLSQSPRKIKLEGGIAHRKEQGIYYTPTYIVDYIVRHTTGALLANSTTESASNIRILDPACGSGSFLIKAYDNVRAFYNRKGGLKQAKLSTETDLPYSEKVEILQNNIFGVDLDPKAVEITQLNLLMKIAEKGERLPVLQKNIKCGNSIIDNPQAHDYFPFNWTENFPRVIDAGGFDVIIGNPPYVRQEELRDFKKYLEGYETYDSVADLFVYFIEREVKLLKEGGYLGMIVSNKWLKAGYGEKLRAFLKQYWIEQFIDFGDLRVFQDATTYPCIIIMRSLKKQNRRITCCSVKTLDFASLEGYVAENRFTVDQEKLENSGWNLQSRDETELFERIKAAHPSLKEYIGGDSYYGIKTGLTKAYVIDPTTRRELLKESPSASQIIKPFLTGSEIGPYRVKPTNKFIILAKIGANIERCPAVIDWLRQFKSDLEKRSDKGNYWYELRACDYYEKFEQPKIIYGSMTTKPRFALDEEGFYTNNACYFLPTTDKRLLAILNSRLGWFLIKNTCTQLRGGYQLLWDYFKKVPIAKSLDPGLVRLVEEITLANSELNVNEKQDTERTKNLISRIRRLESEIDRRVYVIYGLTPKDVSTVEAATPSIHRDSADSG